MRATVFALLFTIAMPLLAAVDGTVTNATTGKPQANVVVSLVQPGQGGMKTVGSAKSDAQGKFKIDQSAEGPQLIQALHQGVTYNKMLAPGAPTSGVHIDVFDATKDSRTAKLSQHIVFLQPAAEQLTVNEVYFLKNDTKTTVNNTSEGGLQFYVPGHSAQADAVRVTISAPGGMPVQRPAEATENPGVYKILYPVKPGETEFNITYNLPASRQFTSKNVQRGVDTRLVVPNGVTLEGDGLTSLGGDPSGKASLYSISGQEYTVKIGGAIAEAPAAAAGQEDDSGAPQIVQTNPRLYGQLPIVLGLAFVILALGMVVLYRSGVAGKSGGTAKGKPRR